MSGNNQLSLEIAIRDYAHDLLAVHTVREYEYQIDEWQKYINRVIDAEKMALDNHQNLLKEILNKRQEEAQKSAMWAMLALSLLTGPAISWIGGSIQYNLLPKLLSKRYIKMKRIYLEHRDGLGKKLPLYMHYNESEHSKVMAKVFGDAAANITQQVVVGGIFAGGKVPEREKSKSYTELSALAQIPENATSNDLHLSLKTRLENALIDEKQKTTKTISNLALEVRRSPHFGKNVLEHLFKTQPQVTKMNGMGQLQFANKLVEKIVDTQREEWAKEWLYYSNNPPNASTYEMSRKIEREIWAMWILDQEYKLVDKRLDSDASEAYRQFKAVGKDKQDFDGILIKHLIQLDIIFPQTKQQLASLNNRNFGNPNRKSPNVFIEGNLDELNELKAIETWAKDHPPEEISGNIGLDSLRRKLPSIIDIHI